MKKIYSYFAVAGVALALTGCADDLGTQGVNRHTGDEIAFGGRASFEVNEEQGRKAPATRTVYTGKTYTENGLTYEGVNWVAGDQVRIFCAEAIGANTADYTVTEQNDKASQETGSHATSLTKNGAVALQWGDVETEHTFYAVYPSPSQYLGTNTTAESILQGGTTLVGEIPNVQTHKGEAYMTTNQTTATLTVTDADGNTTEQTVTGTEFVTAPDMRYAYMVAKTVVDPSNAEAKSKEVYLKFMPIATAVEITVRNLAKDTDGKTHDFRLTNVLVSSANNEPIYGQFKTDLSNINIVDGYGTGYAEDTEVNPAIAVEGEHTGSQISLPMYKDGVFGDPITLTYGDAITFTVFMLPTQDLNSIKVTVQGIDGNKTATINLGENAITKRKKTYLSNIPLAGKNVLPFTQDKWLEYVEDATLVKDLSIPGAGGAASGDMDEDGTTELADVNRQQNLSIRQLWDKGVRCFEFATDIPADGTSSLGDENVICNGLSCGVTLDAAIDDVVEQLNDHPEEFAMVILTYQTLGGWSARKPAVYMNLLNAYWPTVKSKLKGECDFGVYDPTNTAGESRGKLFCIARPTSIHQDYGPAVVTPESSWWGFVRQFNPKEVTYESLGIADPVDGIVVVNGWGALKDKWQQRGYIAESYRQNNVPDGSTLPGRPFDVSTLYSNSWGLYHQFDPVTWNGATWYGNLPSVTYTPSTLTPDFTYSTSLGTGKSAWVQEWARVSDLGNTVDDVFSTDRQACQSHAICGGDEIKAIYWTNTYAEKLQNIKDALTAAVNKSKDGCAIYVNSLCGYFVDKDIEQSYIPCVLTDYNAANSNQTLSKASQTAGLQGNIQRFAYTINQAFYDYLQTETNGTGYTPGSMGIILMDRVGEVVTQDGKVYDAGNKIPGIIVANNFQHKVQTAAMSVNKDNLGDEDEILAPQRRGLTNESGEMSIVWE